MSGARIGGETARHKGQQAPPLSVGSIRNVSILFADIVGSTRMIRFLDTEDARDALDDALRLVTDAVRALGGSVVRVQGDGVMAIFGMLAMTEEHALRAALAACQIRDSVAAHAAQGREPGELQVRVGIHSGPILLRWLEDDFGRILDAVGATAHIAGQVEQNCPPGSVAISGAALDMIDEPVDARPLLTLATAKTGEALAIYELHGVDLARADLLPVKGKALLPLFGRDAALTRIRRTLRRTRGNAPLAIIGEAGMGKSRLLSEAALLCEQIDQPFAAVRGNAILRDVPFGALIPCLRHIVRLSGASLATLASDAALTAQEAASLDSLFGSPAAGIADLPPDERNRQIKHAAARLLAAAGRQRLTLLVDDVQSLDVETRDFIEGLIRGPGVEDLTILLAGRPEAAEWLAPLGLELLQLAPLDAEQSNRLIGSILGTGEQGLSLAAKITARSGGLPLALEEFANFALSGSGSEAAIDPDLPPRLETLFLSRMNDLDADAVELCVHCSALGTVVAIAQLRQIGLLDADRFDAAMQGLVDNRILVADMAGHIAFSHQLVQEATYQSLGRRRRSAVHAAIYEALCSADAAMPLIPSELARHAEMAGSFEAALTHLRMACQEAIAVAAIETVYAIYRRAKAICSKIGAAGQAHASGFALLCMDSLQQLVREKELREDMHALAVGAVDLGRSAKTVSQINMALIEWIDGRLSSARGFLEAADSSIAACENLPRRAYLELVWGYVEFASAKPRQAVERYIKLTDHLRGGYASASFGAVIVLPHVLALSFGAWFAVEIGNFELAGRWASEARTIAEGSGHNHSRLLARLSLGYLELRRGKLELALHILHEAHGLCMEHKIYGLEPIATSWLVLALIESENLNEAGQVIAESMRRGFHEKDKAAAGYYHIESRGRLALALGDGTAAAEIAECGMSHCRDHEDSLHVYHAAALQIEVAQVSGLSHTADLDALAQQARDLGMVLLAERFVRLRGGEPD